MSPASDEDDGSCERFVKRAALPRRDVTAVKQPHPPFEVPVCIVEADKGILSPLYLQEDISQAGLIRIGGWGVVWGDYR